MKHLSEFQKYNFFRRPDWRWERVLALADRYPTPGKSSKRDDTWIREARNFILRWRNDDSASNKEALWMEKPAVYYAYQFMANAGDQPEGAAFLEARLLSRQTPEAIAECMGITPDTVRWYEALFFNVTDKIDRRDWITSQVLLPAIMKHGGWKEVNEDADTALAAKHGVVSRPFLDASLKLFAYFGGQYLVDVMICGFQQGKPLKSPEDVAEWFDNHMATTVRRRSAQAAMQFEINKYNVLQLIETHTRIMELERSEDSQDQQKTSTERHIKAMVDEIPWAVGDQGEKRAEGTVVGRLDAMAGELRDEEVLKLSSGQPVPGLSDDFPLCLPPPRKKAGVLQAAKALEDE